MVDLVVGLLLFFWGGGVVWLIFPQIALAVGALTSNRRGDGHQLWRGSRWVPLLGAIARCHCWVPLGAIAVCHWVPMLGAIAGVPLLGRHCWGAIGCHGGVPLVGCHGRVPLLGASTLISHKLVCAIWGLCWYNFLDAVG